MNAEVRKMVVVHRGQKTNMNSILFTGGKDGQYSIQVTEIGMSAPPAGFQARNILSPCYVLHYVTNGAGLYNGGQVRAGDYFLMTPTEPYNLDFDQNDPFRHVWIGFQCTKSDDFFDLIGMSSHAHIGVCSFSEKVIGLLEGFVRSSFADSRNAGAARELRMTSLIYEVAALHSEAGAKREQVGLTEQYLNLAKSYISHNMSSPGVTVQDVAAEACISYKYLYKIFMDRLGVSPKEYLIRVRMNAARQLVESTSLPVSEIAEAVGYADPAYFTNAFRKEWGMSPTDFRASNDNEKLDPTKVDCRNYDRYYGL